MATLEVAGLPKPLMQGEIPAEASPGETFYASKVAAEEVSHTLIPALRPGFTSQLGSPGASRGCR
jgi:hypothetical protein